MSRKSKTSLLKGRVWEGGGDGASAKWWANLAAYEGSSNVVKGVANTSAVRTRIELSFGTLNINLKKINMSTCKKTAIREDRTAPTSSCSTGDGLSWHYHFLSLIGNCLFTTSCLHWLDSRLLPSTITLSSLLLPLLSPIG